MSDPEQRAAGVRKKLISPEMSKIDPRVARTRQILQSALISLILDKGYEATTITDICRLAKVGRSTFYFHFASKDDLKRSGLEHLRHALDHQQREAAAASENRDLSFSLFLFKHAQDHLDLYRALASGRGGAVALQSIRKIVSDLARRELAKNAGQEPGIPRGFAVEYLVGAYMAVLTWWLDHGARLPPEKIDAMFRKMATQGVLPRETQDAERD
jgi:AcrR family transcriptional regulator